MEKTDKSKAFYFSSKRDKSPNGTLVKTSWDPLKTILINNLEIRKINNNGSFWKTIGPLFWEKKALKVKEVIWLKKVKNISGDTKLCRIFNNFSSNIISDLQIPNLINYGWHNPNMNSVPVSIEIKIFLQHPSIINLKMKKVYPVYNFTKPSKNGVGKLVNSLKMKVIKTSKDIFCWFYRLKF